MSRSYRKNPIIKQVSSTGKKSSNHKVRHTEDIPNGSTYRKVYNTWDVVDNVWRNTLQEEISNFYGGQHWSWWDEKELQHEIDQWFTTFFWK